MPKYRVVEKSFIDNAIREPGDIVNYDGIPSSNLEAIDEEGQALAALSDEADAEAAANRARAAIGDTLTTLPEGGKTKGKAKAKASTDSLV